MTSKQNKRELTPNSYKYIHLKSSNASIKQVTQTSQDKNVQYFPIKKTKQQEINYNLDTSKNNTNKQYSQSSRYSKRESFNTTVPQQEYRNLLRENQKLKKEIAKYQKISLQKEDQKSIVKKLQLQLVETYRVIHFYQGKIKQQEKICKQYEKELNFNDPKKSKINKTDLLQELRNSNSQLRGQVEQKSFEMNRLSAQLRKAQLKHYNNEHKIIELNKKISDNRFITLKPKLDDYEQHNLICSPSTPQPLKRRPLSKSKKILRNQNRESDSEGSGISSEYKNNVYIKRKAENISQSRENSLKSKGVSTISNLSLKITSIQKEIDVIKKQNEKLHDELDAKTKEINRLKAEKQRPDLKITLSKEESTQSSNQLKKVSISKDRLRQIENPKLANNKTSQNNLSMYVSNISKKIQFNQTSQKADNKIPQNQKQTKRQGYIFSEIKQRTLRKLTLNLVRQDISYFKLIDNIVECWISQNPNTLIELLQESPYLLASSQTSQFMFEYKLIMKYIQSKERQSAHKDMNEAEYRQYVANELKNILKNNIGYFKNITIRRDFTLNIQLSNKLKNYQHELTQIISKYGNKLPINQCQKILINPLGLTSQQFLFVQIKNKEEYEDIESIHIADLGKYFLLQ